MQTYLGYSASPDIRHRASSGGVGSSLVQLGFEQGLIDRALSFRLDASGLRYEPYLATSFSDYRLSGSIYQEIALLPWLREAFGQLAAGTRVLCFCLPCQSQGIRQIAQQTGVEPILIGLVCSSQQSLDATRYLLRRLKVDESDVASIQYRGNGWPSGVQITLRDGQTRFVRNNCSLWSDIFHSRLYIQPRCFVCRDTLNLHADIVLADPWLPELHEGETEGKTLFAVRTDLGQRWVDLALASRSIEAKSLDNTLFEASQQGTILRKASYTTHPRFVRRLRSFLDAPAYRRLIQSPLTFRLHCKALLLLEKLLLAISH